MPGPPGQSRARLTLCLVRPLMSCGSTQQGQGPLHWVPGRWAEGDLASPPPHVPRPSPGGLAEVGSWNGHCLHSCGAVVGWWESQPGVNEEQLGPPSFPWTHPAAEGRAVTGEGPREGKGVHAPEVGRPHRLPLCPGHPPGPAPLCRLPPPLQICSQRGQPGVGLRGRGHLPSCPHIPAVRLPPPGE